MLITNKEENEKKQVENEASKSEKELDPDEQNSETENIKSEKEKTQECKENSQQEENVVLNNIIHSIENNKGNINFYFQYQKEYLSNSGVMIGDGAEFHNSNFGSGEKGNSSNGKTNNLIENTKLLNQWIIDHYHTIDLAYMVSCCVFYAMPYIWISEAADLLFLLLQKGEDNTERQLFSKQNIVEFGAEIYIDEINTNTGKTSIDFVRFSQKSDSDILLKCIWNSFPQLRDDITNWLKNFMLFGKNTMFRRSITILGKVAQEDFYYFSQDIVKSLHKEKNVLMDMALAQIILLLNKNKCYQKNIDNMIKNWSNDNQVHHLLTVILICLQNEDKVNILERAIRNYMRGVFESVLKNRENGFVECILDFYGIGMRKFSFYRIMIECFYDFANETKLKMAASNLFLTLFSIDTLYSHFDKDEKMEAILIKLTYHKNPVCSQLCKLWQMVQSVHSCRPAFYLRLGEYFVQIDEVERHEMVKKFVIAALSDTCSDPFLRDIIGKIEKQCRRIKTNE